MKNALDERLGLWCIRLNATALPTFVPRHRDRKVTERLNSAYTSDDRGLECDMRRLQGRSLERNTW